MNPRVARRLNEQFYSHRPWEYFTARLNLMMLAHGDSKYLAMAIADGAVLGSVRMDLREDALDLREDDESAARPEISDFVSIEAQQLVHHISETLIRLFLAHRTAPECPWLEVAQLWRPGEFRTKVGELAQSPPTPSLLQQLSDVFLGGHRSKEEWQTESGEASTIYDDIVNAHCLIFHKLVRQVNEHANLYNASKHGLALVNHHCVATLKSGTGEYKYEGPAISYLEREREVKDEWKYYRVLCQANPALAISLSFLGVRMMKSLWAVAQARYLGADPVELFTIPTEKVEWILEDIQDFPGWKIREPIA